MNQTQPGQLLWEKLIQNLARIAKIEESRLWELHLAARQKDQTLLEAGRKAKLFTEAQHEKAKAETLGLDYLERLPDLSEAWREHFTQAVPIRFAKKHYFFPLEIGPQDVHFAARSNWPSAPLAECAKLLGFSNWRVSLATAEHILEAINKAYDRQTGSAEEAAEVLETNEELTNLLDLAEEVEDLLDAQDEEPVKKLMNSILFQAIKDRSSDIHIDPTPKNSLVRSRVDGVLREIAQVPRQGHIPLINRVKVMAGLDISTKNQPQDGRSMVLMGGKKIDLRVSTIPTVHGERAVLRLLNQSQGILPLEALGIAEGLRQELGQLIQRPHGILLVTGPTGQGKTTTLYSCLNQIDAKEKNIVTIEDPVEYRIPDYGQMQVNDKIGVTFARGLRSMLRQDPDVIMVGEMRDSETAQIAIQAALTGHLVFSTLHTNDAASSVIRLIDMGVEPFLVSSTICGVLAQRLVRKICPHCKEAYELPQKAINQLELPLAARQLLPTTLYKGTGCGACNQTGYQGRVGVYELLIMTDEVRKSIAQGADAQSIREIALKNGMRSLAEDASLKVAQGITTLEEILRVTYSEQ